MRAAGLGRGFRQALPRESAVISETTAGKSRDKLLERRGGVSRRKSNGRIYFPRGGAARNWRTRNFAPRGKNNSARNRRRFSPPTRRSIIARGEGGERGGAAVFRNVSKCHAGGAANGGGGGRG